MKMKTEHNELDTWQNNWHNDLLLQKTFLYYAMCSMYDYLVSTMTNENTSRFQATVKVSNIIRKFKENIENLQDATRLADSVCIELDRVIEIAEEIR